MACTIELSYALEAVLSPVHTIDFDYSGNYRPSTLWGVYLKLMKLLIFIGITLGGIVGGLIGAKLDGGLGGRLLAGAY